MSAAAPNGNYYQGEVIAMCNMRRQRSVQRLRAEYSRVQYGTAGTELSSQTLCCRRLQRQAQCTAASSGSARSCSSFTLCPKDSELREVRYLSSNLRRTPSRRPASMVSRVSAAQYSSSTYTSCFASKSAELRTTSHTNIETTKAPNPSTATPMPPSTILREQEDADEVGVQELTVYEVNQLDRGSPMLLSLSKLATDWYNRFRIQPLNSLGDLVPFTNKLFDGSLKKRLGITAGIISVMRHYPQNDGLLFEAIYSFYFGDYGHISAKGPYKTHEDTVITVTGGSGIFTGVYGTVQIHNVEYPIVLFYKFQLYGIPKLPKALRWDTVPPAKGVRPSHTASMPGFALPNFTD
ncbi:hypothetical protein GOP47_0003151 [Adiantum capillus-veneris]|uniref:allene-oxide cyclase n=1 Tax=Adiantum capillus-veneris TaxID=13818 RepID=A0A9D4ZPV0_ADICA|nr:hypothetical protein GOP47_0003151 [Adiantum capillus-veneris]